MGSSLFFPIRPLPLLLCLCLGTVACEFDQDLPYLPQTRVAAFLLADSAGLPAEIRLIRENEVIPAWHRTLEPAIERPGDMVGAGPSLWLALPEQQQVLQVNLPKGEVQRTFSTEPLTPHVLCLGDGHLFMGDSLRQEIGVLDLEGHELIRRAVSLPPRRALYRNKKFFVQLGERQMLIFHELAYAPLATHTTTKPVEDMQLDNGTRTVLYLREGGQTFRASIDYNTHALSEGAIAQELLKERLSPYKRATFGKAWLADVRLGPDRFLAGMTGIRDFEVDFLEARVYALRHDSLFRVPLPEGSPELLGTAEGRFLRAHFYQTSTAAN